MPAAMYEENKKPAEVRQLFGGQNSMTGALWAASTASPLPNSVLSAAKKGNYGGLATAANTSSAF